MELSLSTAIVKAYMKGIKGIGKSGKEAGVFGVDVDERRSETETSSCL